MIYDPTKRTILCVDDEKDILDSLVDTFKELYNVKTAKNGMDGLKIFKARAQEIALVITDQRMPFMLGTELLSEVNSIKPLCKKILLTGFSDIKVAVDAINMGAVDKYIEKPWDDDELVYLVKNLIDDLADYEFISHVTGDSESFRDKMEAITLSQDLYLRFVETFQAGVCLIDENGVIRQANKMALELLQCKDYLNIERRHYTDFFLLDDIRREKFFTSYKNREWKPLHLKVRLYDKSETTMQVYITFAETGQVVSILFEGVLGLLKRGKPLA